MNSAVLAQVDRLTVLQRAVRDHFQQGGHDHEPRDLWKGFLGEQVATAADDTSAKLTCVVQRRVPPEEDFLIAARDLDAGGAFRRVHVDPTHSLAVDVAQLDSHERHPNPSLIRGR